MEKFKTLTAVAAPLPMINVDTDKVIPARFLKTIKRTGLGKHLFDPMRYDDKGAEKPGFVLNKAPYRDARILIAGENFGCGSSREHAPQSLQRWGIRAIIAESYSEIFYGNCVSLAIPCFTADHETCAKLQDVIESNPEAEFTVDIAQSTVTGPFGSITLQIQSGAQGQLLDGSWNARASLLENLDAAKAVASNLPYVSSYT